MSAGMVRDEDIDRPAGDETPQPGVPLWIGGLDGQFVIADDHLWIAREGDLPADSASHAPRRAPLVEVAMLVVNAARRAGQHFVRPVLVGEQADELAERGPETVMVDDSGLACLVDWAVGEGISVVDVARGRLTHGVRRAQPTRADRRNGQTSSLPPASPDTSACAVAPAPPAVEPAQFGPVLGKHPSTRGGLNGSSRANETDRRHRVRRTRSSVLAPAQSMDNRLAVPQAQQPGADSDTPARSDTTTDIVGKTSARGVRTAATHETSAAIGYLLDGFGGIATQHELIRFAQSAKWIVPAALREAGLDTLTARRDLVTLAWYEVGDDWIALGGSGGRRAARTRHAQLLSALRAVDFATESDGAALDFEDYSHSSALRAVRVAELVHALRKSRPSATKRQRKGRKAQPVDRVPASSGKDDPLPTAVEEDDGE